MVAATKEKTVADSQNDSQLFDPNEMALRGRIGAFRLRATHDPRATTAKARGLSITI